MKISYKNNITRENNATCARLLNKRVLVSVEILNKILMNFIIIFARDSLLISPFFPHTRHYQVTNFEWPVNWFQQTKNVSQYTLNTEHANWLSKNTRLVFDLHVDNRTIPTRLRIGARVRISSVQFDK